MVSTQQNVAGVKGNPFSFSNTTRSPSHARPTSIRHASIKAIITPPRSLHTALKSAHYFRGFNEDYGFCINSSFTQIYAVASEMSWANAKQFKKFCDAAKIPCEEIRSTQYFQDGLVDGAYITEEYTYDARILRDYLVAQISAPPAVPRAAILHRRSPLGR